jgi:hypothetical protein
MRIAPSSRHLLLRAEDSASAIAFRIRGTARKAGVVTGVEGETNGSLMMRNPLRILVTGAGSLLGTELSGALAERGHAVVAMLHRSTAMHRNDGRPVSARPWDGTLPPPGEVAALRGDARLGWGWMGQASLKSCGLGPGDPWRSRHWVQPQ